jgi:hypothetical protein
MAVHERFFHTPYHGGVLNLGYDYEHFTVAYRYIRCGYGYLEFCNIVVHHLWE